MEQETIIRHPQKHDGLKVFNLIKASPPLDLNSSYYYYMMCTDFAATSILAERNGEIIGYISGYLPPEDQRTLFIWQVAIAESAQGKRLASTLLSTLVSELQSAGITKITTTISPSNRASQALFKAFSRDGAHKISTSMFLKAEDFGPGNHEAEELYTIKLKQ